MAGDWWQQYIEIARMRKRIAERRQELLPISIEPLAGRATPPHVLTGDQLEELGRLDEEDGDLADQQRRLAREGHPYI